MYELGIRHAFDLPAVIVAAKRENLPFDIQPQRAILETKTFAAAERTRTRLTEFLQHAAAGDYYKPMEGIRRAERIQDASTPAPEAMKEIATALTEIKTELQVLSSDAAAARAQNRNALLSALGSRVVQDPFTYIPSETRWTTEADVNKNPLLRIFSMPSTALQAEADRKKKENE
jgi:hypothetical protein